MNWKSIRLELGSTKEFPAGSVSRAFLVRLPLKDSDVVDHSAVIEAPRKATFRRHWSTDADQRGYLIEHGHDWTMRCEGAPDRLLQLDGSPVRLGTQVSVVDADGSVLPFKIASVR